MNQTKTIQWLFKIGLSIVLLVSLTQLPSCTAYDGVRFKSSTSHCGTRCQNVHDKKQFVGY